MRGLMEESTEATGTRIRSADSVHTSGQISGNIKENGLKEHKLDKVKEWKFNQMDYFMKDGIRIIDLMVRVERFILI